MRGQCQLSLVALEPLAVFGVDRLTHGEGLANVFGPLAVALVALPVGVLTGLVRVGGGFLIVPALVLLTRLPMKQAVGTSLLVIAMNSFVGFAGYLDQVEVQWVFVSAFTAVAIAGILVGTHLVQYVSQSALKHAFAIFLLFMSMFIFYMQ